MQQLENFVFLGVINKMQQTFGVPDISCEATLSGLRTKYVLQTSLPKFISGYRAPIYIGISGNKFREQIILQRLCKKSYSTGVRVSQLRKGTAFNANIF